MSVEINIIDYNRLVNDYLNIFIKYKEMYDNEKWYNFKKKTEYKKKYKSGLEMAKSVSYINLKFGCK